MFSLPGSPTASLAVGRPRAHSAPEAVLIPSVCDLVRDAYHKNKMLREDPHRPLHRTLLQRQLWSKLQKTFRETSDTSVLAYQPALTLSDLVGSVLAPADAAAAAAADDTDTSASTPLAAANLHGQALSASYPGSLSRQSSAPVQLQQQLAHHQQYQQQKQNQQPFPSPAPMQRHHSASGGFLSLTAGGASTTAAPGGMQRKSAAPPMSKTSSFPGYTTANVNSGGVTSPPAMTNVRMVTARPVPPQMPPPPPPASSTASMGAGRPSTAGPSLPPSASSSSASSSRASARGTRSSSANMHRVHSGDDNGLDHEVGSPLDASTAHNHSRPASGKASSAGGAGGSAARAVFNVFLRRNTVGISGAHGSGSGNGSSSGSVGSHHHGGRGSHSNETPSSKSPTSIRADHAASPPSSRGHRGHYFSRGRVSSTTTGNSQAVLAG